MRFPLVLRCGFEFNWHIESITCNDALFSEPANNTIPVFMWFFVWTIFLILYCVVMLMSALCALAVGISNLICYWFRDHNGFHFFYLLGNCFHDLNLLLDGFPVVYFDSFAIFGVDSASNVDLQPVIGSLEFTARLFWHSLSLCDLFLYLHYVVSVCWFSFQDCLCDRPPHCFHHYPGHGHLPWLQYVTFDSSFDIVGVLGAVFMFVRIIVAGCDSFF